MTRLPIVRITPEEAHERVTRDGARYVDVRTEEEFDEGHPAGAFNVPWEIESEDGPVNNADFLSVMNAAFAKDAPLVIGCRTGRRSLEAAEALTDDGFTNVVDQRAGWEGTKDPFGRFLEKGWSRLDLPVEEGTPVERSYSTLRGRLSGGK